MSDNASESQKIQPADPDELKELGEVENVGIGVESSEIQGSNKSPEINESEDPKPKTDTGQNPKAVRSDAELSVSDASAVLDGPEQWGDKPAFNKQIQREMGVWWKTDRQETRVFDLSKDDDRLEYDKLCTETLRMDSNRMVVSREVKCFDAIGGWKALVTINYVKFRVPWIKSEHKPSVAI